MTRNTTLTRVVPMLILLLMAVILGACGVATTVPAPAVPAPAVDVAAPIEVAPTEPPAAEVAPTEAPVAEIAPTEVLSSEAPPAKAALAAEARTFTIDQSLSEARYSLDELLMGAPKTVVGVTKLVSGTLSINPADPSQSSIGEIVIDARDFTTDSGMRDRATRRFVLQSGTDEYRYITFKPTALEGLPTSIAKAGDEFSFKVTGDLFISGTTLPASFDVTMKVDSDTQVSGLAKTVVNRADYNLTIPNVPSVANVSEEVIVEFQFTAIAQ